jgi:hypothetical protein
LHKRPYNSIEWCEAALLSPLKREVQKEDGRIRHWIWVPELDRYLRVVTLADGVVLDYDAAGSLVGIDVQHASQKADIHHLAISHMPLAMLEAA